MVKPGDLVICRSKGIIGASIRFAQRRAKRVDWEWNHVAVLSEQNEKGEWLIIQAEAKGVTDDKTLESVAPGGTYKVVELPPLVNRGKFLEFVRSQVGSRYGFLTIFSCALDMALPDSICLRQSKTWICSGLVAGGFWFAGFPKVLEWPDLYTVTPADIVVSCG